MDPIRFSFEWNGIEYPPSQKTHGLTEFKQYIMKGIPGGMKTHELVCTFARGDFIFNVPCNFLNVISADHHSKENITYIEIDFNPFEVVLIEIHTTSDDVIKHFIVDCMKKSYQLLYMKLDISIFKAKNIKS